MGNIIKWLLIGLGGLLGLIVIALVAVLLLVDPNDYRDRIEAAVEQETGRSLTIEGDLSLSIFPWLALELGRTTLADAEGFHDAPFLEVDQVDVGVQLVPLLLRRELVTRTVVLDGLTVRLMVDEQGRGNWEDLLPEEADPEPAPMPDEPRAPRDLGETLANVGGLDIRNARLSWEDRQSALRLQVDPFNLDLDAVRIDDPMQLQMDWVLTGDDLPRVAGELSSAITVDGTLSHLALDGLRLEVTASGDDLPADGIAASLRGNPRVDLDAQALDWPDLVLETLGLRAELALQGRQTDTGPEAEGRLQVATFNLRELIARLELDAPDTADPDVLTRVGLSGDLRWADEVLHLTGLDWRLDDTTLNGEISMHDFAGPGARFDLAVDEIDLDRYLPEPAETANGPGEPGPAGAGEIELPLELLRGLDLAGDFRVGRLKVAGLRMSDIHARLHTDNGLIRLDPTSAALYDGRYEGRLQLDARPDIPQYAVRAQLEGIDFDPLITDLTGDESLLLGRGNLVLDVTTRGNNMDALTATLNGNGRFRVTDGAIRGINLAKTLRDAQDRLRGRSPEDTDEPRRTDFSELTGSFVINNGVVRNDDLSAQSPLLRVTGNGQANLPDETIDYRLRTSVVGTLKGQDGQPREELRGLTIPLRFRGDLYDPSISVDIAEALRGEQLERIEREVERGRERLREDVEDRLRGLFD
ncbi:AsmA family protein [Alkalilimnicola ehrlichii MLHE-1]|uniref:AsmA family protein n=1 Tax=Alkalilimnicola ehrlichii (strain ATCC BAA-1101 / DSM 17681 / MLHE-1) TaxID=187272 RepID=Q0A553_ALKEH|nr:AsmA family protein [Alkalilimnicola ehrlichii]ABI58034.1 AsmA family protein [Alkalilimnicola ehrlichii MLHE-1]